MFPAVAEFNEAIVQYRHARPSSSVEDITKVLTANGQMRSRPANAEGQFYFAYVRHYCDSALAKLDLVPIKVSRC